MLPKEIEQELDAVLRTQRNQEQLERSGKQTSMRTTPLHSINKHGISRFQVSDHASEAFNQIADLANATLKEHVEQYPRRISPAALPNLRPSSLVTVETNSPISPGGRRGPKSGSKLEIVMPSAEHTQEYSFDINDIVGDGAPANKEYQVAAGLRDQDDSFDTSQQQLSQAIKCQIAVHDSDNEDGACYSFSRPFRRRPPQQAQVDAGALHDLRHPSPKQIQETIDYLVHQKVSPRQLSRQGHGRPTEKIFRQLKLKAKDQLRERSRHRRRRILQEHAGRGLREDVDN